MAEVHGGAGDADGGAGGQDAADEGVERRQQRYATAPPEDIFPRMTNSVQVGMMAQRPTGTSVVEPERGHRDLGREGQPQLGNGAVNAPIKGSTTTASTRPRRWCTAIAASQSRNLRPGAFAAAGTSSPTPRIGQGRVEGDQLLRIGGRQRLQVADVEARAGF